MSDERRQASGLRCSREMWCDKKRWQLFCVGVPSYYSYNNSIGSLSGVMYHVWLEQHAWSC